MVMLLRFIKIKIGIFKRKHLTDKWTDWIDYWSVDFNFDSKKEIVAKI